MGIFNRATRNIVRRKRRTALILIVLSISIALMITLPASIDANQQASQRALDIKTKELEEWSAALNAVATEIDFNLVFFPSFGSDKDFVEGYQYYPLMNLTDYDKLGLIPNVEKVVPILRETQWAPGKEYGEEYAVYLYDVYGIPLEADLLNRYSSILPSNITMGRNLVAGDRGVVVLDEVVAGNWSVGVGDTVKVLGQDFTVVGIKGYGKMGLLSDAIGVFMSLEEAQRITNNSGKVSFFQIFADNVGNVESIEATLRGSYDNVEIRTATYVRNVAQQIIDATSEDAGRIERTMSLIQSSAWVGAVLAIVVQGAVIFVIMTYSVRERTKEIGTLKAMGSSSANVLGQFVLEGAILSLIAGLIGISITLIGASQLGHLVLPNFNNHLIDMVLTSDGQLVPQAVAVSIAPQLLLAGLGVAVLLGVVGSLYPALKAARTRPSETMRYE